ncbi:hypothetical protein N7530_006311 [Penicillium desertorum]|uniref:Uncharacterized protein n=1 Tax=Penicillium desertorum TaxID=1303715 RepID=A0A9X0BM20_9EURO|nr:hypothetical protein N7530_006311 [Penicillium desertorum]
MLLLGSQRRTSDVDILGSSSEDVTALFSLLAAGETFSNENGQVCFEHSVFLPSMLLLPFRVLHFTPGYFILLLAEPSKFWNIPGSEHITTAYFITFEQANPHCFTLKEVTMMETGYSLAMKVQCGRRRKRPQEKRERHHGYAISLQSEASKIGIFVPICAHSLPLVLSVHPKCLARWGI